MLLHKRQHHLNGQQLVLGQMGCPLTRSDFLNGRGEIGEEITLFTGECVDFILDCFVAIESSPRQIQQVLLPIG